MEFSVIIVFFSVKLYFSNAFKANKENQAKRRFKIKKWLEKSA